MIRSDESIERAAKVIRPEWTVPECMEAAHQVRLVEQHMLLPLEGRLFPVRPHTRGCWLSEPVGGEYMMLPGALEQMRRVRALASTYEDIETLGIDIETYSEADLGAVGLHRYAEDPSFMVLLFACSINGEPAICHDLTAGRLPDSILAALTDPKVLKTAWNAAFERTCLSRHLGRALKVSDGWECTMCRAAMAGLPLSLGQAGEALWLPESESKLKVGRRLIQLFSKPQVSRRKDSMGMTYRLTSKERPAEWKVFMEYCARDVDTEQVIRRKVLEAVPEVCRLDTALYAADQDINDRGVMVDLELAQAAVDLRTAREAELMEEAKAVSGLDNPRSVAQLKAWTGASSLNKKVMDDVKERATDAQRRVLEIRQELGKTPLKKYDVMLAASCEDGRIRGLHQFYGTFTGRWSGRLLQTQNLPQTHLGDLDLARRMVLDRDAEGIGIMWSESMSDVLSNLIRTALVASPGHKLIVCDFSAIEARVTAWLAGEQWRLDAFKEGKDIYCESASRIYGVPVGKHGPNEHLRKYGKIAELALGYQGGPGAMRAFEADKVMGEDEMVKVVKDWRAASPKIVQLWYDLERAALRTLDDQGVHQTHGIRFSWSDATGGTLEARLPSGRSVRYPYARPKDGRLCYNRVDQTTRVWGAAETYGGKLTENIVQAIARDCLAITILRLEAAGYRVVFHVHDEVIIDATPDQRLADVEEIFARPISWAEGLPLKGAGFESPYYLKD